MVSCRGVSTLSKARCRESQTCCRTAEFIFAAIKQMIGRLQVSLISNLKAFDTPSRVAENAGRKPYVSRIVGDSHTVSVRLSQHDRSPGSLSDSPFPADLFCYLRDSLNP